MLKIALLQLTLLSTMGAAFAVSAASKTTPVTVQVVQSFPIETKIEALGTLKANESIQLSSNVTKKVTKINFNDGQRVGMGDTLVELASDEEKALLDEARFNKDEAQKQLSRVKSMLASNAASESLLDQRVREYESARARYLAIDARLQELSLKAPFHGVVGLRNISVGALVTPGTVITTLIDDSRMKLDFSIPSIHLNSLRAGLPITANSRALNDQSFHGSITSIDNQIDPITRSIKVRAILPNADRLLKPGMLMTLNLYANQRQSLVISENALVPLGSNNFVFIIAESGGKTLVEKRAVAIGERMHGTVEIINGLKVNDQVITHGLQKIRAGQEVIIAATESPLTLSTTKEKPNESKGQPQ